MSFVRGFQAAELHGNMRHLYVVVDTSNENWEEYLYFTINQLPHGGTLHVIEYSTNKELKRLYI